MRSRFPTRSLAIHLILVGLAFSILASIAVAHYLGQQHSAGTETNYHYDQDGNLVMDKSTYDDKGRLVEKKEYDKNGKVRKRTTYKYLNGFKEPDTSTTNYQPDGKTPESTSNVDHDKDGNPTITVTTNYDKEGKETGGTKRERDPKTGKDRCYKWDPKKQEYEEVPCPESVSQTTQPQSTPSPLEKSPIGDTDFFIQQHYRDFLERELDEGQINLLLQEPTSRERPRVETARGFQTVIFDTPRGQIRIYFPDDMAAGDTISGTVSTEPKGHTPDEKAKNQTELNGYVIELEGTKVKVAQPKFIWSPANPTKVMPPNVTAPPPSNFQIPTIGQQGRPIVITGPFDGNSSNTVLNWTAVRSAVQDFEKNTENVSGGFGLIAESPRKAVFTAPTNVTGPIELHLKEGNVETKGEYRNVGVNLSAPKTSLIRGESTTLTIQVSGLQGIKEPVPLHLVKGGVVTMQGGDVQTMTIKPNEVKQDGTYVTMRTITGQQTGVWSATATVVVFDVCLQDDNNGNSLIFGSDTGDYIFCQPRVPANAPAIGAGVQQPPAPINTGTPTRNGCMITLQDNTSDRRVQVQTDRCTGTGSATVQQGPGKISFTITDKDMRNNTCTCR